MKPHLPPLPTSFLAALAEKNLACGQTCLGAGDHLLLAHTRACTNEGGQVGAGGRSSRHRRDKTSSPILSNPFIHSPAARAPAVYHAPLFHHFSLAKPSGCSFLLCRVTTLSCRARTAQLVRRLILQNGVRLYGALCRPRRYAPATNAASSYSHQRARRCTLPYTLAREDGELACQLRQGTLRRLRENAMNAVSYRQTWVW